MGNSAKSSFSTALPLQIFFNGGQGKNLAKCIQPSLQGYLSYILSLQTKFKFDPRFSSVYQWVKTMRLRMNNNYIYCRLYSSWLRTGYVRLNKLILHRLDLNVFMSCFTCFFYLFIYLFFLNFFVLSFLFVFFLLIFF